jgi:hypothetical protein
MPTADDEWMTRKWKTYPAIWIRRNDDPLLLSGANV